MGEVLTGYPTAVSWEGKSGPLSTTVYAHPVGPHSLPTYPLHWGRAASPRRESTLSPADAFAPGPLAVLDSSDPQIPGAGSLRAVLSVISLNC